MRGLLVLVIWVGSVLLAMPGMGALESSEVELTSRPTAGGAVTEVQVRVALLNLDNISGAAQNFTVNFAYQASWIDERLRHEGPGDERISLDKIWHPHLQIVNRQRVQETFEAEALVSPEGEVTTVQRVWGPMSQPLVLNDFPFDHQKLRIDLAGTGHREGSVVFVVDPKVPSVVAESLSISDWELMSWTAEPRELAIGHGSKVLPGFRMTLEVKRNRGYHLVNVILPLVMIIFMSWVVFWINPKNANPRVSVSVTAMLTLIAYRFAVGASLPKIGYLTRMDWFILGSSILVFASLLEVIVTSCLADQGRIDTACKINRRMRLISPVVFLVVVFLSFA